MRSHASLLFRLCRPEASTSRITRHMPHVTHHASHVTYCTSHVTSCSCISIHRIFCITSRIMSSLQPLLLLLSPPLPPLCKSSNMSLVASGLSCMRERKKSLMDERRRDRHHRRHPAAAAAGINRGKWCEIPDEYGCKISHNLGIVTAKLIKEGSGGALNVKSNGRMYTPDAWYRRAQDKV